MTEPYADRNVVTRSIDIVDLAGDAHERGRAFGMARRRHIQGWMLDWLDSLREVGIVDPETYVAEMLRNTNFMTKIREHTPDLLDEVRGIAFGAEQPPERLLVSQYMDEEWAYRPTRGHTPHVEKCSSVAIRSRQGLTWIGQNMDLASWTDGHQALLRIAPHAPEVGALIFTIGGMVGLLGVNARGVGVCVNSLPQLPSAREGLPVAFVIRRLLQADSAAEAARVVSVVPHATGQHYLIADSTDIRSFEASPARVVEYCSADPARVLHTNHPLAGEAGEAASSPDQANTVARLRSLTTRLMAGDVDLKAIEAALSSEDDPDHPVCRTGVANGRASSGTGMVGFTTGSMITALERGPHAIGSWVSAGPPSLRGYAHVRLDAAGPT